MIYGVGTDVCDINRMAAAFSRRGIRFARKILGERELQIFEQRHAQSSARGIGFLATRFSAKEALSKAVGLGMQWPMAWHAVEILPGLLGKPELRLYGKLAQWFSQQRLVAHVSLSDEVHYVVSFVVVEIQIKNEE
jgi:holo-[acyl-carrier protein] synthase